MFFFASALQGRRGFLPVLGTIILVFVGLVIGQIPLTYAMASGGISGSMPSAADLDVDQSIFLLLMILSFLGGLIGLLLGVVLFHRRSWKTLITPYARISWSRILLSFSIWIGLTAILEVCYYLTHPANYVFQFDAGAFFPLLLVAILFLPIQTSFEELFFRGYLMQVIGSASKSKWLAVIVTGVLFGLLHLANPEVSEFGFGRMMFYYIGFGIFAGVVTVLDDRLELMLGMHAATNIYGAAIVTFDASALQTPALFRVQEFNLEWMLIFFIISLIVYTWYFGNRYEWISNFKKAFSYYDT